MCVHLFLEVDYPEEEIALDCTEFAGEEEQKDLVESVRRLEEEMKWRVF